MKKLTNGIPHVKHVLEPDKHANSNGNARYSYREQILFDTHLSEGARLLYQVLDAYSRSTGMCWPKQDTLADRLGLSRREVMNRLSELIAAGKIKTERGQYELKYTMGWVSEINHIESFPQADVNGCSHVASDVNADAHLENSDVNACSQQMCTPVHISTLLTNTHNENKSAPTPPPVLKGEWKTCPYCKGSGQEVERFGHTVTCWACRGKKRLKVEP